MDKAFLHMQYLCLPSASHLRCSLVLVTLLCPRTGWNWNYARLNFVHKHLDPLWCAASPQPEKETESLTPTNVILSTDILILFSGMYGKSEDPLFLLTELQRG